MQYLTLGNIVEFKKGFSFEKNKHKTQGEPILKVLNVQNNKISEYGMIYFDKKDYSKDLTEYLVNPGDIILTIQGASSLVII
ncbi:hypothetical protein A6V39_05335 [Candidatus Mycoplasma haematobovis]|uniref:Type I restriction modification DNA specificity domain-containing protein n=1 Tax=Candidatus Mycoplasma haematobovis TaxID=432608 RepID=A0A1A9QBY3_9MOLU|nr:hypothetical protein [Candidatus Mycoplasma haematobovis]OAL09758.1 hypothetical protein A6V39_05335 [Candidatus Mycoplasma haematobovis]